jgi:hypothetical protein
MKDEPLDAEDTYENYIRSLLRVFSNLSSGAAIMSDPGCDIASMTDGCSNFAIRIDVPSLRPLRARGQLETKKGNHMIIPLELICVLRVVDERKQVHIHNF